MKNSCIFAVSVFVLAGGANAATYTHSIDFVTATTGQSMTFDDYSGVASGTTIHSGDTINGVTYSFATAVGTDGFVSYDPGDPAFHYLTRPGNTYVFQPGDAVTFSFAAPVKSFGVHVSTALLGYYQLTTNGVVTETTYNSGTFWDDGSSIFLGAASSSGFTSLTLTGGYRYMGRQGMVPWSGWGITDVTYGVAPVPEPETYALMLAGLALLGAVGRRRKA